MGLSYGVLFPIENSQAASFLSQEYIVKINRVDCMAMILLGYDDFM